MKRISDTPNISKEMKAIYGKLLDKKGTFEAVLPLHDTFLEKYPYYTEALVFKARALMGLRRDSEAMKYLKMAKKIDKWRFIGRFDEAEIYLEKRKNEESIHAYVEAVRAYAVELKNGIDGYLLCCNSESK
jgi:tetratricopeptide (TPR) repeat protein